MESIFQKYLDDNNTPEEKDHLLNKIANLSEDDIEKKFGEQLRLEWQNYKPSQRLHPTYKKELFSKINESGKINAPTGNRKIVFRWSAAAVIFLCASIAIYLSNTNQHFQSYQTGSGEQLTVYLPDSSEITLNGNSEIKYQVEWKEASPRVVWLTGEAFFNIRKMPNRENSKFNVNSDGMSIQVLGTSFNVRSVHGRTVVVLETGKVKLVSEKDLKIDMEPGEKVTFEKSSGDVKKEVVEPISHRSWMNKKLYFENTKLSEVASKVDDTFGLKLIIENSEIEDKFFTGVAYPHKLEEFIQILESAFDVQVEKVDQQTYIIK